ncbi:antibiotic biosynthesis monooxygenase [Kutzneria sp. CA-103260]|uniref:antibiotic biosynthesis monooxygenase n=1 Tax=Kutzneria sp. CA-103260 TaxID=2802641 RepID=UPI001BAAF0C3|nr:antibiotic biosynthesis monooxygenase [Kutzneria sp. CA-103260]QUQ67197.1 hypothetical protein JJ691_49300 [Kutzneria sp. CA-103260]
MSGPITVTLSYEVRRGRASQFSVSATALLGTAAGQRGYLGAGVMGTSSTGRDWQIFYRFDDEDSLAEWEQSHAYARWIEYVEKFATRSDAKREVGEAQAAPQQPPVAAPAGRGRRRREAAHTEAVRADATQVMDAARMRDTAQQRSGQHARTHVEEPNVEPAVAQVDATQVMSAARLRDAAQQMSGQQMSGQHQRPQDAVANAETAPVDATQVMSAARLRDAAQQRSAQFERPHVEQPLPEPPRLERPRVERPHGEQLPPEPPRVERPRVERPQRASAQWAPDQWDEEFRELVARESGWGPAPSPQSPVPHSQPLPRPGTVQWERAQREMDLWEAEQQQAAQYEAVQAAQREAAQREAAQRDRAQRQATQRDATQREIDERIAAQREAAQQEIALWEAEQQEATRREAAQQQAAQQEAQRQAALREAAQRAVGNHEQPTESQWEQPGVRPAGRSGSADRERSRRWWNRRQQPEPERAQASERSRGSEQPSDSAEGLSPAQQRELFGDIEVPRTDGDPLATARGRRER